VKVSLAWLGDYVDISIGPPELAELLNFSGTKVERIQSAAGNVSGVTVARVLSITAHPNADNLTLVDVEVSDDRTQRVVCGARNFAAGDLVPFARVGARLGDMTITARKIRGQTSAGMLCSAAELGISDDHTGILVLPPEAEEGQDVVDLLNLDDTILELEVTPNRPDCMGMIGVAREVAAITNTELRLPPVQVPQSVNSLSQVKVEILDPHRCPRYVAGYIEGVSAAPSPAWLSARLLAGGIRPITNIVDVTNYVMLETGQPLHAFDARRISEKRIVVRVASEGEKLTTLDGEARALTPEDLLITDGERALAIAGIMGGEGSEVAEDTTEVVLESACFERAGISFSSRRLGLRTEASARFERGSDPAMPPVASARALELMRAVAGGRPTPAQIDANPVPFRARRIQLRPRRTEALLGITVPAEDQVRRLRSIGLEVDSPEDVIDASIPSFRHDLIREEDLIEEVARLEGLARLPSTLPSGGQGGLDPTQKAERSAHRALVGFGLCEAWTTAFSQRDDLDRLGLPEDHPARTVVTIENPMAEDDRTLRTSLLPGLLRSLRMNLAHGASGTALFEIAKVYEPVGDVLPAEKKMVAAVFGGSKRRKSWAAESESWNFFAVKGVVQGLCGALATPELGAVPYSSAPFHPTRAAQLLQAGNAIGVLGELHPDVCERFDVPERTVAFEVALEPLLDARTDRPRVVELGRFPAVLMDIAVVVDEQVPAADVGRLIAKAGAPETTSVDLFDVYRGDQVPAGKKSLAYALRMQAQDRTLTDQDAATVRERIIAALRERVGGELRS
jgi:phenylalanyl-tRNA synthetase beta chain